MPEVRRTELSGNGSNFPVDDPEFDPISSAKSRPFSVDLPAKVSPATPAPVLRKLRRERFIMIISCCCALYDGALVPAYFSYISSSVPTIQRCFPVRQAREGTWF